jgi:hypothetical protein
MDPEPVFHPITVHLLDGSSFDLETESDKRLYLQMVTSGSAAPTPRSGAEAWRDRIAMARRAPRPSLVQETVLRVANPAPVRPEPVEHISSPELHYVTPAENGIIKVLRVFKDREDGLTSREIFDLLGGAGCSISAVGDKISQMINGGHPRPSFVERVPGHKRYRLTHLGRTAIFEETRYPTYKYGPDGNKL